MENHVDFVELADYCQQQAKEKYTSNRRSYGKTYYGAISKDSQVLVSSTPHILKNAFRCILIHKAIVLAETIWYPTYYVQYIDENGCVSDGQLDEKYRIPTFAASWNNEEKIALWLGHKCIFRCLPPLESAIPTIWSLYQKCKECSSDQEAILLGKLTEANAKILKLERDSCGLKYQTVLVKTYEDILKKIEDALPKE